MTVQELIKLTSNIPRQILSEYFMTDSVNFHRKINSCYSNKFVT